MTRFKLTAKQERFCLLIVKGEAQSTAYEQAGYKCRTKQIAATSASTLMKNPNIIGRIQEVQAALTAKTIITLESLTEDLMDTRQKALAAGSFGPAVAASVAVARLHGFMVERSEVTVMNKPAPLPTKILELSEDEWKEQFGTQTAKHLANAVKIVNKR
jgi:phage terminase small subunit